MLVSEDGDSNDVASANGASTDEGAIRAVLRQQAQALENDNLEAYMETIHPEAPLYESTRSSTRRLMQTYDMEIDLTIDSISVDGDTADADVTQVSRLDGGSGSQSGRTEMIHELRTYEGDWKVYDSTVTDREQL